MSKIYVFLTKSRIWSHQITSPHLIIRMLDIPDAADLQQMLAINKDYMIPWIPWAVGEPETVEIKKKKIRTWKGEFYSDQNTPMAFLTKLIVSLMD